MSDLTTFSAILLPNLIAGGSLLTQYLVSRMNRNSELSKMMYNDRLKSYKDLGSCLSNIVRSAELVLEYKQLMEGKIPFADLFENKGKRMPKEMHDPFVIAVYGCTVVGKQKLYAEVDQNRILYSEDIVSLLESYSMEVLGKIPNPLFPETIDRFIEENLGLMRKYRDDISTKGRESLTRN